MTAFSDNFVYTKISSIRKFLHYDKAACPLHIALLYFGGKQLDNILSGADNGFLKNFPYNLYLFIRQRN